MDATMKGDMPPLALPKQEYMERAKAIWQELDLGPLRPQARGSATPGRLAAAMGRAAKRAAQGRYLDNGKISEKLRRKGLKPETKYRPD